MEGSRGFEISAGSACQSHCGSITLTPEKLVRTHFTLLISALLLYTYFIDLFVPRRLFRPAVLIFPYSPLFKYLPLILVFNERIRCAFVKHIMM